MRPCGNPGSLSLQPLQHCGPLQSLAAVPVLESPVSLTDAAHSAFDRESFQLFHRLYSYLRCCPVLRSQASSSDVRSSMSDDQ